MIKIYSNENFNIHVVVALRKLGYDILTVFEAGHGNKGVSDLKVLEFAINDQRALLTENWRDFLILHNQNPKHFGIIICKRGSDTIESYANRIDHAIRKYVPLNKKLIRIYKEGDHCQ